jgi:hypothetical protein
MSKILFRGGILVILIWVIGYFGFHASGAFHILLVVAIFALIIRLFYNKSLME